MVIVDFGRYVDNDQYLYVGGSNNSAHNTSVLVRDYVVLNNFVYNLYDNGCIYL